MSTISMDYVNDIINTCKKGNLLITYYRNYDVGLERIEELFKYIDEHKSPEYNWVKIDVTNCPEVCAGLGICHVPCTIWYTDGLPRNWFSSYDSGSYIVNMINRFYPYTVTIEGNRDNTVYYDVTTQENVEVGDTWFWS